MTDFVKEICTILSDKKAQDITIIEVTKLTSVADYMIIACGRSTTQVRALAENVEDTLAQRGIEPRRKEGYREGRWALVDYGDVIVHIFLDDVRLFYCLEELWGKDDNITKFEE